MDGLNAGAYIHGTIEALDGFIGSDSINYWEIGNYTDYNLSETAKIIGHGSSFIQLGDSSTWRLATNRIHTGWHVDSDKLLHFPKFTDGTNTLYWDYGLHSPTEKSDKFLYIRTASGDAQLSNLLYDIDDSYATPQWDYKFWIDGSGNVHAPGFYIGDSTTPIGGGPGTVAERLISGAGSATQPVYFRSDSGHIGEVATTTYQLNAAGAKGVDTSIAIASTSTDLPTSQAVAAFVEGKGYKTTDENVKSSQANTTKLYLVGKSTNDTSTGTLNFDSNIYADTTAGALHATTFNGYTLAAASAKGVDTSMPTTATDSNVPTTKLMKSFVEGKGYIATETDPVFAASAAHGITSTDISNWNSKTSNTGTVTSVRVQASSPLQSSISTAQSTSLDTTISFVNQNKNLVLAGPSTGSAAAPTFRSLVADDIPGLAWSKITSGKPTTLSGYGITDAAGSNALVGLSAKSNDAGVTTFTATRASGEDPLSFEVSIVASAAAGANALRDSEGPINKGSVTKPVYFSNGIPVEANTYAGGTAVTLNNASKASSTASFYAPTSGGTTTQVLVGNGTTSAPVWKAISDIVPSKASTADAFSSAAEVKLTGDTTGSASSTKGWSITTKTDRISTVGDNRAVATTPNDYVNKIIFQGIKTNSSFGSPSTDNYSYVVGLRGWADSSGGNSHEFAFNNSGINHRSGATTSWGAWEKLVTSANYTDYTVTKTGSGASGTWGISISGTAAKATADASGNTITSTYVKKAGDTMTGALVVEASNSYSSYNEGIRINAGASTFATLLMGGTNGTTSGTNDGAFWIGVYNTGSYARRLMIAHNGSTATNTYFYSNASGTVSPWLHLGNSGTITSDNADAVTGGVVYTAISNLSGTYVKTTGNEGILGTKVFGSGTSYGTVTNNTTFTQKANINYNSTLDAIVFSFA